LARGVLLWCLLVHCAVAQMVGKDKWTSLIPFPLSPLPAFLAAHRLRVGRFVWVWADVAGRGRVEVLAMEVEIDSPSPR
jgi:hypothetical protein